MKRWTLAVAAATTLTAGLASGQSIQNVVLRNSFNPIGAGARGLGMGGAFIAVADDGTAASFNPAGLAQLRRTEIALVGFGDRLRSTIEVRGGATSPPPRTTDHKQLDFAGLSVPFELGERSLTVELSYQRSVDLFGEGRATVVDTFPLRELGIDEDGTANFIGDIAPRQSGAFHTATLATGYQATPRLALGFAANYWIAEWTVEGTSSLRGSVTIPGVPRGPELEFSHTEFRQKQSFRSIGLSAGFLLKYPRVSIGGVARFPFTGDYDLDESGLRQDRDFQKDRVIPHPISNSVASRLHWPRSAGVGVALRPFRGLTLAADYARASWSRTFVEDVPDGALLTPEPPPDETGERQTTFKDRNFFDLQPASLTRTQDTSQWRAGAEYLISLRKVIFPLRAGLFRERSPVPQLDTERGREIEGYTVGTGVNLDKLVLDVAYEHRRSEGAIGLVRRRGVAGTATPSEEDVREERVVISLIYRFAAGDDPLKRAFRFLFGSGESD